MGTSEAELGKCGRSVGSRQDGLQAVQSAPPSAYSGCSFYEYRHNFATASRVQIGNKRSRTQSKTSENSRRASYSSSFGTGGRRFKSCHSDHHLRRSRWAWSAYVYLLHIECGGALRPGVWAGKFELMSLRKTIEVVVRLAEQGTIHS